MVRITIARTKLFTMQRQTHNLSNDMKIIAYIAFAVALLFPPALSAQQPPQPRAGTGGSAFAKNDITYSTAVATPHTAWANALPGGPLKGFFIPSVQYGRDMVELMQRLALAPVTDSIDRSWDINCWGVGDFYGHETRGDRDDFQIVYGYVEKDLTGAAPYEVMMIPGINGWSRLTRPSRDAIIRRVKEGAGLVLIHPFVGDVKGHPFKGDEPEGDARLWDISPLVGVADDTVSERGYPEINQDAVTKGRWEIAQPTKHFITEGIDLNLLPEGNIGGSFYKYKADGDVLVKSGEHPIIAVKNYGKGRVVSLAYVEEGFTPQSINPIETKIYWNYWEYQYSLLARALLWASGRPLPVRIASLAAQGKDDAAVRLTLAADAARKIEIEVRATSEYGQSLGADKITRDIGAGENAINIPARNLRQTAAWPSGKLIFDVIVRDAQTGATLNWGAAQLQIPKRAMMTQVKPAVDVYQRGEALSAVLAATGDLTNLKMRMSVYDDMGRLLGTSENFARGERTYTYQLSDFLGKTASVVAELIDEKGAVVDQMRAAPVMVVQNERREREYTALVSFGGTKHYLQDAQMRQVRDVAADTGFTWSGGVDNSLNVPRGSFGVYWYDRGPTTPASMEAAIAEYKRNGDYESLGYLTKKELYKRTGDKTFLRRTPSFSDSAFIKELTDITRATARNKARYNMDYYFVGDEGSLTSYGDPYDFDWSGGALADFRAWLKTQYITLDALNRAWRTSFPDWNAVVPFTTEEAQRAKNFAPWADHRTFMEMTFARTYQTVRDAVTEVDSGAHIAVSGTQATNAYNGADWSRLDTVIDDFLSYDGGNQWDIHRSFAKQNSMIGFWTGYGSRGTAVQNAIWTAAIHNVLHPNVFWMYSFLDPDMGHSQSARDMGAAFRALRYEGIGKLLMESARLSDGIAIHYSMPSIHGATILGYHQRGGDDDDEENAKANAKRPLNFPNNRDGWVKTIKDLGLQFDFVSSAQVERDGLLTGKYKVLILPLSLSLSTAEIKAINSFMENGGTVIADAGAGMMDEHCAWREDGAVNDLFGITVAKSSRERALDNSNNGESATTQANASAQGWQLNAAELGGIAPAETYIRAGAGTSLLRFGATDAVIATKHGRGWAIYLNTIFDKYGAARKERTGGANYRALINAILNRVGVRPVTEISSTDGHRLTQAQVARYHFADGAEILAVVKDNVSVEGVVGQDGVRVFNDAGLGRIARQEITIKLPRKVFVTDIRTGQDLGRTDVVKTSIVIGDAVLLGLTETKPALTLRGTAAAARGEHPSLTIASPTPARRLIRCHVFAPDGRMLPIYARNILLTQTTGAFVLPTALNDRSGKYKVRVTDVMTGATAEKEINLR